MIFPTPHFILKNLNKKCSCLRGDAGSLEICVDDAYLLTRPQRGTVYRDAAAIEDDCVIGENKANLTVHIIRVSGENRIRAAVCGNDTCCNGICRGGGSSAYQNQERVSLRGDAACHS